MKKLLLALALVLAPAASWAQCNGVFPNNTVCGNATGSSNTPRPTSPAAFQGSAGGTNGQIQYNNSGALGGFTPGGDVTFAVPNFTVNTFGAAQSGKVPASGGGTANFLRADGSWTSVLTANSASLLTLQDATSSQDTLIFGVQSSTTCDPGYDNGSPGSGPCAQISFTPNSTASAFQTLLLKATNARAILASSGGAANPEIICADTNAFGVQGWLGTNQAGCGNVASARTGTGAPMFFNMSNLGAFNSVLTASSATSSGGRSTITVTVASGSPLVIGETIVGGSIPAFTKIVGNASTNPTFCTPNCTGSGGTGTYSIDTVTGTVGSELMIGGPSGAEGSIQVQIQGGSLDGSTQNILAFLNATGCTSWIQTTCTQTKAGSRLGEVAAFGMSNDGKFTQTETGSINWYADQNFGGTFPDGSYSGPTNLVIRAGTTATAVERNVAIFDYNGNLFLGANGSVDGYAASGNAESGGITNAVIFYGQANDPSVTPTHGGMLYYKTGVGLRFKGATGTVTTVAPQ